MTGICSGFLPISDEIQTLHIATQIIIRWMAMAIAQCYMGNDLGNGLYNKL